MGISLVERFDQLSHFSSLLSNGNESVFSEFLRKQHDFRRKWLEAESESNLLRSDNKRLHLENSTLENKLKQCRSLLANEINTRINLEHDKKYLQKQIAKVKEVICESKFSDDALEKLGFLNTEVTLAETDSPDKRYDSTGSILSPSDIDITDDEVNVYVVKNQKCQSRKRSSLPLFLENFPCKKTKNELPIEESSCCLNLVPVLRVETNTGITSNRSYSEPIPLLKNDLSPVKLPHYSEGDNDDSVWSDGTILSTDVEIISAPMLKPEGSRRLSADNLNGKLHDFCPKTMIRPDKCIKCNKRIMFGKLALKCKDCRIVCHRDCENQIPIPCAPVINKPKNMVDSLISDFVPQTKPYIPPLILYCIMEIETRGMNEVGLYRIPGFERDVKELKEKFFFGRGVPNLCKVDVHVICGCIKDFLRSLKEPLITYKMWHDFIRAAELQNKQDSIQTIKKLVKGLPEANKDTLAYLVLHLQMIAKTVPCKMNITNLSRVLGPSVIGYSSSNPEGPTMLQETKQQVIVMELFLKIEHEFWMLILNTNMDPNFSEPHLEIHSGKYEQFSNSPALGESLAEKARSILTHTPLSRNSVRTRSVKRMQTFFASPNLQ